MRVSWFLTSTLVAVPALAQKPTPTPTPAPTGPAESRGERLSIQEAVDRAIEFNHSLRISREQIRAAEADRSAKTLSTFVPEISATLGANYQKDAASSPGANFNGEPYGFFQGGLQARQVLLRGSASWQALRYVDREIERLRFEYDRNERDQIAAVVKSFYGVLLSRKKIDTYERVQRTQRSLLGRAQQRFRVGSERKLTVLQFQTKLALLEPQIIQARNELETKSVELLNLLGDRRSPLFEVVGSFDRVVGLPLPSTVAKADETQPELQSQLLEQAKLDAQKAVEMSKHWPSLEALASINRSGTTSGAIFDNDNTRWSAGLGLTIPLFTGFSSFRERENWAARQAQLRIGERKLRDELAQRRVQVSRELESVRARLNAQRAAVELAREAYATGQQNYGLGTATYSTLFETEQALTEAELSYNQTEYDYLTKLADFYVVSGQPLRDLIKVL